MQVYQVIFNASGKTNHDSRRKREAAINDCILANIVFHTTSDACTTDDAKYPTRSQFPLWINKCTQKNQLMDNDLCKDGWAWVSDVTSTHYCARTGAFGHVPIMSQYQYGLD